MCLDTFEKIIKVVTVKYSAYKNSQKNNTFHPENAIDNTNYLGRINSVKGDKELMKENFMYRHSSNNF
tara:strand:+ start:8219 stop:8422 length:204 start_codon:yes stop_codon:yes gene_type:complete